ncbi:MAG: hypothetical protein LBR37_04690 [Erysipelotrichaceae bacterium]|jgi:p-aminobenzoyl-glutamate transporter AbgT|nr:hypothetical protein [Erysipelotrichaceae bacterium]
MNKKQNEEQKIRALYGFWKYYSGFSLIGTILFALIGVIFLRFIIVLSGFFFAVALVCLIVFIATQVVLQIVETKGWFDKLDKEDWEKKRARQNQKRQEKISLNSRKIAQYQIELNDLTLENRLKEILVDFEIITLDSGILFLNYFPR